MRLMLATLCINEMEWLPRLVAQHKDWPGLCAWVFVEAADAVYNAVNGPGMVDGGLSTDGTTEFLESTCRPGSVLAHVKHGISRVSGSPAQGKCEARNRCMELAESVQPDWLLVLDADEFWTRTHQTKVLRAMQTAPPDSTSICFRYRHLWRPPCWAGEPLLKHEVVGGFWAIPHCHAFRWRPGMRYDGDHMRPGGAQPRASMLRNDLLPNGPQCVHAAFASDAKTRLAKHAYYAARGEETDPRRAWYVASRAAWATWRPGSALPEPPRDARRLECALPRVIPYDGPRPEVLEDA